jgi:hypothetical protein
VSLSFLFELKQRSTNHRSQWKCFFDIRPGTCIDIFDRWLTSEDLRRAGAAAMCPPMPSAINDRTTSICSEGASIEGACSQQY